MDQCQKIQTPAAAPVSTSPNPDIIAGEPGFLTLKHPLRAGTNPFHKGPRHMAKTIGLIVNPIAGMGGSVGLKGTDGEMAVKARELGADPVTPDRAQKTLDALDGIRDLDWLAAPGKMGADYLEDQPAKVEVVGEIEGETSPKDTRAIARGMIDRGADLILFVGGDGTARDMVDAVGTEVPVVAVPAGVKMFSSAFALNPRSAARLVEGFLDGAPLVEEEVLDIDEDSYRNDRLDSRLYGALLVPEVQESLQPGKVPSSQLASSQETKRSIAAYLAEKIMEPGVLYLLGPGTTVRALAEQLEVPKTLLGVDAVVNGEPVGEDLNEEDILALFEDHPQRKIVVTPIGGNGFIFGRGNKQFTPRVIREVGREHILVLATRQKLQPLDALRVDTGDREVDQLLEGYLKVYVGYLEGKVIKVISS